MTRNAWLWLVSVLTLLALASTYVYEPVPDTVTLSPRTRIGWSAPPRLLAGDGVRGWRDGAPLQARFSDPYGIARAADGTLFIADAGDSNRIRRIGVDGAVATFAGSTEGFRDGAGALAAFNTPSGLALDGAGNLYVADTGNHAIRRVAPDGTVTTLAGSGVAGFRDGPGAQAQFNGPIGVAVDDAGQVYVADTYNDRIRVIGRDGTVRTLAGGDFPGDVDGVGIAARFDTPSALAVDRRGNVWVADTRNNTIRHVSKQGVVTTLPLQDATGAQAALRRPVSIAVTREGVLYVGELFHGRVLQVVPGGPTSPVAVAVAVAVAGAGKRLARPTGLALAPDGTLYVADATAYRVHALDPAAPAGVADALAATGPSPANPLPATLGRWPLRPQDGWHEVVGTLGEVRGNYQGESRDHLHNGLDVRGDVGQEVVAIADGKVSNPLASWGQVGQLGEGMALDDVSYIHMRVGRTARGEPIDPARFVPVFDAAGSLERMRVRRGTRFRAGDVLGTINAMAHVHLIVGTSGYERNAIALGFRNYSDRYAPHIDAIELLDAAEQPLQQMQDGRVLLGRDLDGVQIVVDAWDQVDNNLPRRRLGLHALGYQWLDAAGTPLPGFEAPRMSIDFDLMPTDEAVKLAYAADSGITVHGSSVTRFRYVVTNTVRGGTLATGAWRPRELAAGDYLLRITAKDYSGNLATAGRDLPVRLH
ncbi:NHL repeat-containing protein [Lysobacter solisilvae (ex Woo and Kim 2022)]|uniref:Gluconolaconase n=1 Tax=Agrilutibacter terrestris TaxID=2865112 RepID=A0A7H0FX38_9GAMM|nr:NHL repeat-containing protein [Lysobacter terrestris]QNP40604.1 gluconolaconase [Lysobacter terrestris]